MLVGEEKKDHNSSKENVTLSKEAGPINTGVAAQMAYNNLASDTESS